MQVKVYHYLYISTLSRQSFAQKHPGLVMRVFSFSGITSTEVSWKVLLGILDVFILTTTFWASEQDDRHRQYRFTHKIITGGGDFAVLILPKIWSFDWVGRGFKQQNKNVLHFYMLFYCPLISDWYWQYEMLDPIDRKWLIKDHYILFWMSKSLLTNLRCLVQLTLDG